MQLIQSLTQPVLHLFVNGERDLILRTTDKLLVYFNWGLGKRK